MFTKPLPSNGLSHHNNFLTLWLTKIIATSRGKYKGKQIPVLAQMSIHKTMASWKFLISRYGISIIQNVYFLLCYRILVDCCNWSVTLLLLCRCSTLYTRISTRVSCRWVRRCFALTIAGVVTRVGRKSWYMLDKHVPCAWEKQSHDPWLLISWNSSRWTAGFVATFIYRYKYDFFRSGCYHQSSMGYKTIGCLNKTTGHCRVQRNEFLVHV